MKKSIFKSKKAIIITLVLSFVGVITAIAGVKAMNGGIHGFIEYKIQSELDLTDNQVDQLNKIKEDVMKEKESHKLACENDKEEYKTSFINGTLDEETINLHISEKKKFIQEKVPSVVNHITDVHDILNSDQRVKLVNMIDEMHGKFKNHSRLEDDEILARKMKEYVIEKTETELNFTDSQKVWFAAFVDEIHGRKDEVKSLIHESKDEIVSTIRTQFLNDEMDKELLIETFNNVLSSDIINNLKIAETIVEVQTALTQEQRENMFELIGEFKEMHGHKKGHGRFFKGHSDSNH